MWCPKTRESFTAVWTGGDATLEYAGAVDWKHKWFFSSAVAQFYPALREMAPDAPEEAAGQETAEPNTAPPRPDITELVSEGQEIVVQVAKDSTW